MFFIWSLEWVWDCIQWLISDCFLIFLMFFIFWCSKGNSLKTFDWNVPTWMDHSLKPTIRVKWKILNVSVDDVLQLIICGYLLEYLWTQEMWISQSEMSSQPKKKKVKMAADFISSKKTSPTLKISNVLTPQCALNKPLVCVWIQKWNVWHVTKKGIFSLKLWF